VPFFLNQFIIHTFKVRTTEKVTQTMYGISILAVMGLNFQIRYINAIKFGINIIAHRNDNAICCCEKNNILKPTFSNPFITNNPIIRLNFFSEEYLFHIISSEIEVKANIIDQANTIIEFEGVQSGRLIDLYHARPALAKWEAADAVIITNNGISR
jgi:hypothetical protein